jgi:cytochrome P450
MIPPEGITIDGTYVPGNVNVGIGSYAVQHDPRYWAQPDEFIPERWLGEGPFPAEKQAYFVFSHGPYGCIGKHLAYMELAAVTAGLIRAFDMALDPKYDSSSYIPSVRDNVISSRVYLPMVVKPRAQTA